MFSLGFSPCPNDTFIFHALVHDLLGEDCRLFREPILADVETLNEWALQGRLEVSKMSFAAYGHVRDTYTLLNSGAALGRGCGPLLVAGNNWPLSEIENKKIAIPGRYTTAATLLKLFAPGCTRLVVRRFDKIMESVAKGEVDGGVIIHESRFIYPDYNLVCLQDLGAWWEGETGCPIPLGGIAAKSELGSEVIEKIDNCIRASILYGYEHPGAGRDYVKHYAAELDDSVIDSHISLYVNKFSKDLGREGLEAVEEFLERMTAKLS
ncbi:MAG: 1,4-dihydroxy-6-naphthoate synthase [Desulfobia sp.]